MKWDAARLNPLKRVKFISKRTFKNNMECFFSVSIPSNGSSLFQCEIQNINFYASEMSLNPLKRVKFISMHIHLGIEHKVFIVIKIAMVDRFMIGGRGYIDKFFIIVYIASNCVGDNDFGNKVCKYVIIEQFSKIA